MSAPAAPEPGAFQLTDVPGHLEMESRILARDLRAWAQRDGTKPQPEARQAANRAMRAIDRTLAELHAARQRLVTEIRAYDAASAARVDAILASFNPDGSTR